MSEGVAPASFRPREGRPAIVGHRGVRGARPENTLAAFELAAAEGADAVELDVRLCKSGEIVVFHDPDLARMAGDPRSVADLRWEELARLDLGAGAAIPQLVDALAFCRARGLGVNVELKRDVPSRTSLVLAVAQVLLAWDPTHDVVASSFDPWMLGGLRRIVTRLPCAQLVHASRYVPAHLVAGHAVGARGVHLAAPLWTEARIRAIRQRASWIAAWTIERAEDAARFVDLGADALITDVPGAVREALG